MPYCHLFYHLVWTTKNRKKLITPKIEPIIYGYLQKKAISLGGAVFAVDGDEEHTHVVTSIPPSLAVATFVGQVKGATSAQFNSQYNQSDEKFYWQEEYGAFSFDGKRLPNVIAYVKNQKQHHKENTTIPILERVDSEDLYVIKESQSHYYIETEKWRREMLALSDEQ